MDRHWAWSSVGAAMAAVVLATTLLLSSPDAWDRLRSEPLVSLGAVAVGFSIAGAVAAARQPLIGHLALAIGLSSALALLGHEYGRYALVEQGGDLPLGRPAAVAGWTLWAPGFGIALGVLPLVFPDGRLPSRRWRPVMALVIVAIVITTLASAAAASVATVTDLFSNSTPSGSAGDLVAVADVGRALLLVGGILAVVSLVVRYRRAAAVERRQLLWVVTGFGGLVLFQVAAALVDGAWLAFEVTGALCFPAALAVAINRHGLWDIERLVSRTAVYLAMSGLVALGYLVVIGAAATVFEDRSSVGATAIAAVAVAAVFQPAREAIQSRVDHAVYGTRRDASATVDVLHARLSTAGGAAAVIESVTTSLRESMRIAHVAIETEEGTTSAAPAGALRFPLRVEDELLGALVVAPAPGDSLGAKERRTLKVVAAQVALVVFAARLLDDAHHARELVVVAREEERGRLRRDLHDGLGPALAGLGLQASAAATFVSTDPPRAAELLDRIAAEAAAITSEVRRIVDDLRPSALDDLGLVDAVRRRAIEVGGGSLPCIDVDVPDALGPLPAAVEVAAYRIATEAILNAQRHAGASRCSVRIARDSGLDITVTDDGRGIDRSATPGVGLQSMRARAEELGGAFEVVSGPTGTAIHARLPL